MKTDELKARLLEKAESGALGRLSNETVIRKIKAAKEKELLRIAKQAGVSM